MTYSKTLRNLAETIVSNYAKFNGHNCQYQLNTDDIPRFDLHEISSQLMLEDSALACEATGSDNPAYKTKMLPAMIRFMADSTNTDERIEFVTEWRDGVTSYFRAPVEELLNDCLHRRNCEDSPARRPTQSKESFGIHY